ncbi:CBS domain-containing protein [Shewanella sp. D64]|uniref:CBS domain-containing protein n=1 Tax=unclassified Shewanella TaxID=196818 RepID=UPI0022BA5442|nr:MULTISPECIES: CBS domain-containing protein [unclassified Shewanella]MEC4726411.1 CBS domain-containing protein [Shewanella sp. D64]MEC4738423.1 CBS domain-containing protein [Shewanella sp. E94]WBJ94175.1 CBS domain-containing protein [Shewanella sp. MTB7]
MDIIVSQIMTGRVVTIEMDDRLVIAKEIFDNAPFHHLLVVENGELQGVLSERDFLRALSPNIGNVNETERDSDTLLKRVHQVMTRDPITTSPNKSIKDASKLLLEHGIGSLPVLDLGQLVGIITWKDLLRAYSDL